MAGLPEGFEIDQTPPGGSSPQGGGLPPGFEIDNQPVLPITSANLSGTPQRMLDWWKNTPSWSQQMQAVDAKTDPTKLSSTLKDRAALLSGFAASGPLAEAKVAATATPAPPPALSTAGQVAHDAVADAITSAKTSGNVRPGLRSSFSSVAKNDDALAGMSPEQQASVKDLSNTQAPKKPNDALDLALLATEGVFPTGVPATLIAGKRLLSKVSGSLADRSALSKAEQLRQSIIDNDPGQQTVPPVANPTGPAVPPLPTPWGQPSPPQPPPIPLARMKALLAAAQQHGAEAGAPPPPPINPLALPTSITTPARNLSAGFRKVGAMQDDNAAAQAASQPSNAQFAAADQANSAFDRMATRSQMSDAQALMAARRANAAPVTKDTSASDLRSQITDAQALMSARRANASTDASGLKSQINDATAITAARQAALNANVKDATGLMAARRSNAVAEPEPTEAPEPPDTSASDLRSQITDAQALMAARRANEALVSKVTKANGKTKVTNAPSPEPAAPEVAQGPAPYTPITPENMPYANQPHSEQAYAETAAALKGGLPPGAAGNYNKSITRTLDNRKADMSKIAQNASDADAEPMHELLQQFRHIRGRAEAERAITLYTSRMEPDTAAAVKAKFDSAYLNNPKHGGWKKP